MKENKYNYHYIISKKRTSLQCLGGISMDAITPHAKPGRSH